MKCACKVVAELGLKSGANLEKEEQDNTAHQRHIILNCHGNFGNENSQRTNVTLKIHHVPG